MIFFHPRLHEFFVEQHRKDLEGWAQSPRSSDFLVMALRQEIVPSYDNAFVPCDPIPFSRVVLIRTPMTEHNRDMDRHWLIAGDSDGAYEAINEWVKINWRSLRRKAIDSIAEMQP